MIETLEELEKNNNIIADAMYDENYEKLEELTGIVVDNQSDFESKFENFKKNLELKSQGYVLTDPDTNQWVRKLSDTKFDVIENGEEISIDVSQYSKDKIKEIIQSYYSSYDEFLNSTKEEDRNGLIAEMLAETGEY